MVKLQSRPTIDYILSVGTKLIFVRSDDDGEYAHKHYKKTRPETKVLPHIRESIRLTENIYSAATISTHLHHTVTDAIIPKRQQHEEKTSKYPKRLISFQ